MRIWSLHPQLLDSKGLVALWRETLLAQKVLRGETRGYRQHPQLLRFKQQDDPLAAIATYLHAVQREATRRGYTFDASKILAPDSAEKMEVSDGQLAYEFAHLKAKLKLRDPAALARLQQIELPPPHSLFVVVHGEVAAWEVRG